MTAGSPKETVATFEVWETLTVFVDLQEKRMIRARIQKGPYDAAEDFSPADTLCLAYFYAVTACHVKAHSLANWGIDETNEDPFIRRLSSITVMYKYFGVEGYAQCAKALYQSGLALVDHSDAAAKVIQHCDSSLTH